MTSPHLWFTGQRSDMAPLAWPPVLLANDAALAVRAFQFAQSEWLSPDEIEAGQRTQLASVAAFHSGWSSWVRESFEQAGLTPADLAHPGALQALPLLDRRTVQADFAAQPSHAFPPGTEKLLRYTTSGSTGEPVIVWKTDRNHLDWQALTLRYYHWTESGFDARLAVIKARAKQIGLFPDWGFPLARFHQTGPLLMLDITQDVGDLLSALVTFQPDSLIAYPSVMMALIAEMDRTGKELPALRRARTLGETLDPAVRLHIEARLGVIVRDCYSSEELGYIAIECPQGGLHIMSETLIVEILDEDGRPCPPGQPGRVVVTDIQNLAAPMFRYVTGDHASRGEPCGCGRGLPTLARVLGRERNMIERPDGTRHWPITGFHAFRELAPVIQYQFVQHTRDHIEVRLVTERPMSGDEEAALTGHIRQTIGFPATISYTYFNGRIPLGSNGKFEEFMSRL